MPPVTVRAIEADDRPWVEGFVRDRWGSAGVVAHGELIDPAIQQGFVAEAGDERVGLVTYRLDARGDCEVITIDSVTERAGVGSALLDAAAAEARRSGCRRLWLITTNDKLNALRFYQRRGLRLVALRPGAVDESRRIKPEISEIGEFGIPLRDELELELLL
jgi:ribosomal protein S18 acetylase RimI-like enzyme